MSYEFIKLWSKIDIKSTNECWEWQGSINRGYGNIYYAKDGIYETRPHRLAWMLHHQKEIPEGLIICHTCDNPRCCNPNHLYAGTYKDNGRNAAERGKGGRRGKPKGYYGVLEGLARIAKGDR